MNRVLSHYVLIGGPSAERFARLVAARKYLAHFGTAFGFDIEQAMLARVVTIVGDAHVVSEADEVRLKSAGCRVERLYGDAYALECIWRDRLERNSEFA